MPAPDPAAEFVRDALQRGLPEPDIRAALRRANWTTPEIDAALASWTLDETAGVVPSPKRSGAAWDALFYALLFVFLGMVVGKAKVSLFESADVFILPTSQENFGFVLPEAMACRTPVITTKGVDIWPELDACGGAVIVKQDATEIADAATKVLADPEKAQQMGDAGREWVFATLDAAKVVSKFIELYQNVIDESN